MKNYNTNNNHDITINSNEYTYLNVEHAYTDLKTTCINIQDKTDEKNLNIEMIHTDEKNDIPFNPLNIVDNEKVDYIQNYFVYNPLDQFEIRDLVKVELPILFDMHLSITNIGLYCTIATVLIITVILLSNNLNKIIYNKWSLILEIIYDTVYNVIINQINKFNGQYYFPFIYSIFLYILINNLIGMIPYNFSYTSHFLSIFSLSFMLVIGASVLGISKYLIKFFSIFVPSGCPLPLLPLLVFIELISYLSRNISLGLRLSANILSGHMLLNILAGFCYNIINSGFVYIFISIIPLAFIIAFSGLELAISFIQAQVFVVLTSSYIKDGLDLH